MAAENIESILITIKEAEKVFSDVHLRNKIIVVFHLTNFISKQLLTVISHWSIPFVCTDSRLIVIISLLAVKYLYW